MALLGRITVALLLGSCVHAHAQPLERPLREPPFTVLNDALDVPPEKRIVDSKVAKPVGGKPAAPGQFKWQVALIQSRTSVKQPFAGFFCGGSLIDWRWVLTAAHCTFNRATPLKPGDIHVYLGSHDFSGGERIVVKNIIRHEAYNNKTYDNDLALFELAHEPKNKNRLELLALATDTNIEAGQIGVVVGWGATQPGIDVERSSIRKLQYVDRIEVRSTAACNQNYIQYERAYLSRFLKARGASNERIRDTVSKSYPENIQLITDNMFCAGTHDGSQDSCFGDSGGPLVMTTREGPVQAGVVSFGPSGGCALTNVYGVYAKVARYLEWIRSKTK